MAKKGYPGLVLVPPSDRTILRRRLLRWALFIGALLWGVSTLPIWPPPSDDQTNCRFDIEKEGTNGSAEKCGQSQVATEPPPPNQSEFNLTPVSQAEGLGQPQTSPSYGILNSDPFVTQNNRSQDSEPNSSGSTNRPTDHTGALPAGEKVASGLPASPSDQQPNVDVRLAEQGDAFAQYRLGRYYAQRDGRQTPESVSWYKKASPGLHRLAETGNGQAMYVLGVMYTYGRGVARDTEQARRWLTQAIEQKVTAAQPVLASLDRNQHAHHKSQGNEQARNMKPEN
jgi:hypothetical protein